MSHKTPTLPLRDNRTPGTATAQPWVPGNLRFRQSLRDLETQYGEGNREPLTKLIRAWHGIQNLPPDDPNSFFMIAGYHGEPFRGAGWGNAQWWGGFCNHGNVLFPTWHRAYVLRLEDALRSIPGCEDVTMPYWNETDIKSKISGMPKILTAQTFELDGETIKNPLRSYTFQAGVWDNIQPDPLTNYSKDAGYTTVRFPYSGLAGTEEAKAKSQAWNNNYPPERGHEILNQNVINWLSDGPLVNKEGREIATKVAYRYTQCLFAPNYTVFSNTTSAIQWNEDHFDGAGVNPDGKAPTPGLQNPVVPLESPHNDIHLAIGGFNIDTPAGGDLDPAEYDEANGDMGENDTAAFDPALWFHHAYIDYVFWQWQQKHGSCDYLEIIDHYPGTNSVDSQGPTPGTGGNTWLTLDTPLAPFVKANKTPYTSNDVINIESQLHYTYKPPASDPFSLLPPNLPPHLGLFPAEPPQHIIRITGISRNAIPGSFVIKVKDNADGRVIAVESVLSRWHVSGCANCQNHLNVKAFLPLRGFKKRTGSGITPDDVSVEVHGRTIPGRGKVGRPDGPVDLKPRWKFGVIGK